MTHYHSPRPWYRTAAEALGWLWLLSLGLSFAQQVGIQVRPDWMAPGPLGQKAGQQMNQTGENP